MVSWTPTQRRILKLLSDSLWHTREELHSCLSDELAGNTAVAFHITRIRQNIRSQGEDIATLLVGGKTYWMHVRQVAGADE